MNDMITKVTASGTGVVECNAIPIEREKTAEASNTKGKWLWTLIVVAGLIKLAVSLVLLALLIKKYPRILLGAVLAGAAFLLGRGVKAGLAKPSDSSGT